tara:strand:- start:332 stop:541 length:210 start_codon:yes stop_codon:yes gene_type:complete
MPGKKKRFAKTKKALNILKNFGVGALGTAPIDLMEIGSAGGMGLKAALGLKSGGKVSSKIKKPSHNRLY